MKPWEGNYPATYPEGPRDLSATVLMSFHLSKSYLPSQDWDAQALPIPCPSPEPRTNSPSKSLVGCEQLKGRSRVTYVLSIPPEGRSGPILSNSRILEPQGNAQPLMRPLRTREKYIYSSSGKSCPLPHFNTSHHCWQPQWPKLHRIEPC